MIETGEPEFHSVEEPNEYYSAPVDQRAVHTVRSLLCVPIYDREGEVIGACEVFNSSRGGEATDFKGEDSDLLSQLLRHLYLAIENSRLMTKMSICCERLATIEPEVEPVYEAISH